MPSPHISVLLPTRGRTTTLLHSIESLLTTATHPDQIEILLAMDRDDTASIQYATEVIVSRWPNNIHIYQMNPLGYGQLHVYYNTLSSLAQGYWFMVWNDDTVMQTTGWDKVLDQYENHPMPLLRSNVVNMQHPFALFPIIKRTWCETLSTLSHLSHIDRFIYNVMQNITPAHKDKWIINIPVDVLHDRADLTGNNLDQTYRNRPMLEGNPNNPNDFHHFSWSQKRMQECDILADYMKSQNIDTSWWENIKTNKQDPWEKLRVADVNQQMRQFQISKPAAVNQ